MRDLASSTISKAGVGSSNHDLQIILFVFGPDIYIYICYNQIA